MHLKKTTCASYTLFILHLKKIRFDSILSDMLARLGFIISPPWLKTRSTWALDAGPDNTFVANGYSFLSSVRFSFQNSKQEKDESQMKTML